MLRQEHENKTYFIAICRYYGNVHNFVMGGEYDRAAEQTKTTSHPYRFNVAVGKYADGDVVCPSSTVCVSGGAYITHEWPLYRKPKNSIANIKELFYQAYEVSEEEYNEFKTHINSICVIHGASPSTLPIYSQLSPRNNCKHSSISLLQQGGVSDASISTSFLSRLYNRMVVKNTEIITPIFILPRPLNPNLIIASPLRYRLLNQLRAHMVDLAKTRYGHEIGVHKVNALRGLYNQIMNLNNDDPAALLSIMHLWKESTSPWRSDANNMTLINAQRRTSLLAWFNPKHSKSADLINKLVNTTYQQALAIKLPWMSPCLPQR